MGSRRLRIGEVVIRLDSLRARCVVATLHPDTLVQDVSVPRDISARFGGKLALNCAVEHRARSGSATVASCSRSAADDRTHPLRSAAT